MNVVLSALVALTLAASLAAAALLYTLDFPALGTRVGKKAAGRELDGRTWDEYPIAAHIWPALTDEEAGA